MNIFIRIKRKKTSHAYKTVYSIEEYVAILKRFPGSLGLGAGAYQANLELSGACHE